MRSISIDNDLLALFGALLSSKYFFQVGKERERKSETHRDRERETDRQTDRQKDRQRQRQRLGGIGGKGATILFLFNMLPT